MITRLPSCSSNQFKTKQNIKRNIQLELSVCYIDKKIFNEQEKRTVINVIYHKLAECSVFLRLDLITKS